MLCVSIETSKNYELCSFCSGFEQEGGREWAEMGGWFVAPPCLRGILCWLSVREDSSYAMDRRRGEK